MSNFSFKSFAAGLLVGLLGITTVTAAGLVQSAQFRETTVTFGENQTPVALKNKLAGIVNDTEPDMKLYMPVREVLEELGFNVTWSEAENSVNITPRHEESPSNITVKRVNTAIGYQTYALGDEVSRNGEKWVLAWQSSDEAKLIEKTSERTENGVSVQEQSFSFTVGGEVPTGSFAFVFEQINAAGQKTGRLLIYEVNVSAPAKPVIYLYPEEKTDVTVSLDYNGQLTTTYPAYNGGWSVTAYPDGTLINHADNKEYSYLFWEGKDANIYDMSKGFVVKGSDTAEFLQEKLAYLGLTPREYNEFIVYWLPKMQENPYNLITFQQEAYTENAKLTITPEPDALLRVFMAYRPLEKEIDIAPQALAPFERTGFTVVEWGGAVLQ